jgi:WD40 repeat protein
LKGHKGQVWTLAFDVDNVLASGSLDATIKLWNITTGQEVGALLGHLNCVWSVAFDSDEMLASAGCDCKALGFE